MTTKHTTKILLAALALGALGLAACRSTRDARDVPETVPQVDIDRYLGTWYEIASFPQRFQKGCTATTAKYSLRDDGDIRVENSCRKDSLDGELTSIEGKAFATDATNAKLKVQFFWPFRGDYWILELGDDYEYAVVGSPDRDSLWILSRTRQMDDAQYTDIFERLRTRGWDVARLQKTPQPAD